MVQPEFGTLLRQTIGLDVASIGAWIIERAVDDRQLACRLPDAQAYWDYLQSSAAELQALIEAVVVPETWFFRDREAFTSLARLALDEWAPTHSGSVLRVLSLPCSTGEEPYSAAIALLAAGMPPERFHIDAIDISARVLAVAERAVYSRNSFRGSDLGFRDEHFTATPEGMRLNDNVRNQVRFQQGNLFAPRFRTAAESYNAIFCRNLLIYLDRATQDRAVGLLEYLLSEDGTLFVGPAETGLLLSHDFTSARQPMAFAFRKTSVVSAAVESACRVQVPTTPPRPPRPVVLQRPPRPVVPPAPRPVAARPVCDIAEAARLADQGRLTEAARLCEEHIRVHGATAQALYLMGLIRDAAGDPREAAQYYRKVLYLDRNHDDALIHLALLVEKQGDLVAARRLRDRTRRHATDKIKAT